MRSYAFKLSQRCRLQEFLYCTFCATCTTTLARSALKSEIENEMVLENLEIMKLL